MQVNGAQGNSNADAHTYGILATRLTAAFSTARAALAPHAEHLPVGMLADLDALLEEFVRRRIRIAIYGEVKAGKSTLLNAIAGAALSPVAFEPLTSVPVRLTYGPTTAWRVGDRRLQSVTDLEQLMRDDADASTEVVVETDLDLLQLGGQVDLVDTPGVGSDARLDAVTAEAVRALDAVVVVVRYPALFTQFTRRLVEGLDADLGKLFVVWNLDGACAELSAAERARHAETLRAHVAGAHELFLVDARAAIGRAASDRAASGLETFTAALRRFVSSGGRDVVALREAAKRAHLWLTAAQQALSQRRAALERALANTRQRLEAIQAEAIRAEAAARTRCADFEAAVARIGQEGTATATKLAADLGRHLRAARRRWIRNGDLTALDSTVTAAITTYADAVEAACQSTFQALQVEAAHFGSAVSGTPRPRTALAVDPWAPADRRDRALTGRWPLLRRALFRRWYLPGVTALERVALTEDVHAQAAWRDTVAAAACQNANDTLAHRLSQIEQRATHESQRIEAETSYVANDAEALQLRQHLPVVADQLTTVTDIATEARGLLATS
jgi:signal recognition particle receptor subunit beta